MHNTFKKMLATGFVIIGFNTPVSWANGQINPNILGKTEFLIHVLQKYEENAANENDELKDLNRTIEDAGENLAEYRVNGVFEAFSQMQKIYMRLLTAFNFMDLKVNEEADKAKSTDKDINKNKLDPNVQFKSIVKDQELSELKNKKSKSIAKVNQYMINTDNLITKQYQLIDKANQSLSSALTKFNALPYVVELGKLNLTYKKNVKVLEFQEKSLEFRLVTSIFPSTIKKLTGELSEVRKKKANLIAKYEEDKKHIEEKGQKDRKALELSLQKSPYGFGSLDPNEPQSIFERYKKEVDDYKDDIRENIDKLEEQQDDISANMPGGAWMTMDSVTAPVKELLYIIDYDLDRALYLIQKEQQQLDNNKSKRILSGQLTPPPKEALNLLAAIFDVLEARYQMLTKHFYNQASE